MAVCKAERHAWAVWCRYCVMIHSIASLDISDHYLDVACLGLAMSVIGRKACSVHTVVPAYEEPLSLAIVAGLRGQNQTTGARR